jgi:hypothetical protein
MRPIAAPRHADDAPLPLDVRKELAVRALSSALEQYVRLTLEGVVGPDEWVSQRESPLGVRRHLEAVRRGDLPGVKAGKLILVRRVDLETYLRKREVSVRSARTKPEKTERASAIAARLLSDLGMRDRRS